MVRLLETVPHNQTYDKQDLNQAMDLVKMCLQWVPAKRVTAQEALDHPFLKQI